MKMIWVRVVSPTAKQPDTREEDWGAVSLNGYGKIPSDPKILYTNARLSTELENWNLGRQKDHIIPIHLLHCVV